jgi:hypothetical protein
MRKNAIGYYTGPQQTSEVKDLMLSFNPEAQLSSISIHMI